MRRLGCAEPARIDLRLCRAGFCRTVRVFATVAEALSPGIEDGDRFDRREDRLFLTDGHKAACEALARLDALTVLSRHRHYGEVRP